MHEGIDLSNYDPEAVAQVKVWVEFVADVIEVDPANNAAILTEALRNLAQKAQAVYPQLASGERISMSLADLGDWPLPDDVGDLFLRLSGDVLFIGEDGPLATASAMRRTLAKVADHLNEGRGA